MMIRQEIVEKHSPTSSDHYEDVLRKNVSNMDRTCENTMEVDVSFLKTLRGGLKTAELDIFNAVISAIIIFIVCAIAVAGHDNGGTVAGGVFGFIVTILLSVDAFLLFRSVTFNQPASATKTAQEKSVFPKSAN
ncbi:chemokine-like factor isoform X4 [Protopterus annectens]|uniref:chemokine-like factor isoform X4 n=1 Tax=Protopterus annectens TaxID=7888 RepID=UPI001CFAC9E9|nr:chemokine-like factor isoform X4 [Protopterus annectens]